MGVAYADGQVTEFEDDLAVAGGHLLGVSSRERIELRERVAEKRAQPEDR